MVMTDDTHETLLYSRWQKTYARINDFLRRNVWNKTSAATPTRPDR
jgi:hypothetical protein